MNKPNLFDYASSELSQDAFIAWLLAWADDRYIKVEQDLSYIAKKIVSLLTNIPVNSIHCVEADRQWKHIDVWAEINEDTFLVIEDKTSTSYHGTQLEDYKNATQDYYNGIRSNLIFTYIKTGNEPAKALKEIQNKGYKTFNRRDILDILNLYKGGNAILIDYRKHLQNIEDAVNKYQSENLSAWDDLAWQGFYMQLNTYFEDLNWGYVPNQSGGFWGAWWYFEDNDEVEMYLQFEQNKLCLPVGGIKFIKHLC